LQNGCASATVEKEIESHKQQLDSLNRRLGALKRAAELFESEQGAISELLQAGSANGGVIARQMPILPVAGGQRTTTSPKPTDAQTRRAPTTPERTERLTGKAGRSGSQNKLTRLDMIAAFSSGIRAGLCVN
jgi:hypothetical protein